MTRFAGDETLAEVERTCTTYVCAEWFGETVIEVEEAPT